jgi:hypothetical protein
MAAPSILSTIMRVESGGRNVTQGNIGDINNRTGDLAQGFYQITGGTWRDFGGDKTGHKSALDAPYDVQLQIAQNIPVQRWGPATQQALKTAGYEPRPGETLGQMLARYNENPTSTRPEDVGGSSGGGSPAVAAATPTPNTGLLGVDTTKLDQLRAEQAATATKQAAATKEKEQEAAFADLQKTGMSLLAEGEKIQPAAPAPPPLPDMPATPVASYEFVTEMPDFQKMMMQQRLQRRV